MKFDNIIIGGGLTGLSCGIRLAEAGRKCAIISSGQSAIHFFSGSLDLLSAIGDDAVSQPLAAMKLLPEDHPYKRVGIENCARLAEESQALLERAKLKFRGTAQQNHYVMTPMGGMKPTWLTLDDFTTFENGEDFPWKKAKIMNFKGFLDFHTLFVKDGLAKMGVSADIHDIAMKEFEAIRRNPSEMRSSNIAKVFDQGDALNEFAAKVNELSHDTEVVILPAVFGLFENDVARQLKSMIEKPLLLLPAIPPSVPGIRSQILLRKRFEELGGLYFLGDHVNDGIIEGNQLKEIHTTNHGDIKMEADQFILATGSFYSKGLVATPDKIYEPIFGLDIDASDKREDWFDEKVFNNQPFMQYGVKADDDFRATINGNPIDNLFVAGSVLGGANALKEGSGAGISLLTSLYVAENLLKSVQ